jgi:hypothetical protein
MHAGRVKKTAKPHGDSFKCTHFFTAVSLTCLPKGQLVSLSTRQIPCATPRNYVFVIFVFFTVGV